jgi:molybdopterin converting factor small subunit
VVTVRYFAAARAAAGVAEVRAQAATVAELRLHLGEHNQRLADVLARSSFLVNGLACHDSAAALPEEATVDVLPPFAGG